MSIRRYIGRIKSTIRGVSEYSSTSQEAEPMTETRDFADPSMWKSVVDDRRHLYQLITDQPQGGFCKFRGNWSGPINAYERCSRVPLVKHLIDQTGWQRLLSINTEKSSMRLVEALVERWWDTTHTFHLPCGELGFTPLDWTMLTGLSIGSGEAPPCIDENYPFEVVQSRFFPEITESDWKSSAIRGSFLRKYFHSNVIETAQVDENLALKITRAFFMFFLSEFLFTNGSSLIRSGWLAALEDLNKVGTYDWGGQALALLYMSLDSCSTVKVKSFNGPWQVLEYWAYEYTNICVPIAAKTDDMADVLATSDKWPRITRWNKDQLDTNIADTIRYNIGIARYQLEMRSSASIIWQPYSGSKYEDEYEVHSANILSRHRVIFQYCSQGVWYLGDRCFRQITGFITIPIDPPKFVPRLLPEDFCPPIDASVLVRLVPQKKCDKYWKKVSVGAIMPTLSHHTNVDFIGPASNIDRNAQLPFPAPPFWAPSEYATETNINVPAVHGECAVEVPLFPGGTVTRILKEGSCNLEPHGVMSYDELYQRYQESTYNEAQLRRFIMTETVLKESIPVQVVTRRRSVSTDQSSSGRRSLSTDRPSISGMRSLHSTPEYVPNTQFDYDE